MKYTTPYIAPTLTVDAVIFEVIDKQLHVVLIKRSNEPFKGQWALPGGYNARGETTYDALKRIVLEKAGLDLQKDLAYIEQLYAFDTVARDPRGHAVSVTYIGCGRDIAKTDSTASVVAFPVDQLPKMAFDHADIVRFARKRLSSKLSHTNLAFSFLSDKFTLSELQTVYEAIFDRPLDKRNFRKKFLSLNLIHETDQMKRAGAHRPARLYEFNQKEIKNFSNNLD